VSELLFENSLTSLEPAEIVALLSCLVFQEKVDVDPTLTPRLQAGVNEIRRVAGVVARTQQECGMDTPVDECVCALQWSGPALFCFSLLCVSWWVGGWMVGG
jgi:antiviral helicase SKI2